MKFTLSKNTFQDFYESIQPELLEQIDAKIEGFQPNFDGFKHNYHHQTWSENLKNHPNKKYFEYIIDGITNGFPIGHNGVQPHGGTTQYYKLEHVEAQLNWIKKGLNQGYLNGPYKASDIEVNDVVLSPFGAVAQTSKIRPIINLSFPKKGKKFSVNDTIDESNKYVSYITIREIVKLFKNIGHGAYMWTADAKDAYLMVPIKDSDKKLIGFQFGSYIFYLNTLMFGLASACQIYQKFADAIQFIIINKNKNIFLHKLTKKQVLQLINHYLDDFFGVHKSFKTAQQQLNKLKEIFTTLNVPLKVSKFQGPDQLIKLLGTYI